MNRGRVCSVGLLLGLVLTIFLSGCVPPPGQVFHPPVWIQGTWGPDDLDMDYEFTTTTVIQRSGSASLDLGEPYRRAGIAVQEVITNGLYSFTLPMEEDTFLALEFRKITDTSISMTMRTNAGTIGPRTLYRR